MLFNSWVDSLYQWGETRKSETGIANVAEKTQWQDGGVPVSMHLVMGGEKEIGRVKRSKDGC